MTPLILGCLPNLLPGATLTAGSEAAETPAQHLLTDEPGKVWRSTTTHPAGTALQVDLGSPQEVASVVITGCTVRSSATWRLYGGDVPIGEGGAGATVDSGLRPLHVSSAWVGDKSSVTACLHLLDESGALAPAVHQHWRLQISDSAHPAGYLEAEFLAMGPALTAEIDVEGVALQEGFTIEAVDLSVYDRLGGGGLWQSPRRVYLRASLPVIARSTEGARDLLELLRCGQRMSVCILPDTPGVPPVSLWASIVGGGSVQHRTGLLPGDSTALYWASVLNVEEV